MTQLLRAAVYARVSTDGQVKSGTIDSQLATLLQRLRDDGLTLCHDGYSGSTLIRPSLERLRVR